MRARPRQAASILTNLLPQYRTVHARLNIVPTIFRLTKMVKPFKRRNIANPLCLKSLLLNTTEFPSGLNYFILIISM